MHSLHCKMRQFSSVNDAGTYAGRNSARRGEHMAGHSLIWGMWRGKGRLHRWKGAERALMHMI